MKIWFGNELIAVKHDQRFSIFQLYIAANCTFHWLVAYFQLDVCTMERFIQPEMSLPFNLASHKWLVKVTTHTAIQSL